MTLVREYQPTFVLGDGETKEFSYLFEEVSENFIKVIVKHSDDSTYVPVFSVDLDSHKVVFGESETAPLDTDLVCIYRQTPDLQDTPFRTLQGYDARALENILSKIVAMIQELKANGFSTQILQGTPWQLDLLHPADDGASVVIDYNARILKKGLYFQIVSGNLQVSADGNSFISMPKSADITEFRCLETVLEDLTVIRKLQYKVNNVWYDAEHNAQATADEALSLAQTVQGDLSSHKLNHNNPHETSLGNLTDTDITSLQVNQFLKFNGTKWVNVYSSAVASWGNIIGNITDQTDLMNKFSEYVKTDGSSTMTGVLKMRATSSFQCAIAPFWDGVGFYKLNSDDSVTLIASIETPDGFVPWVTNTYNIGSSLKKWKNLYLAGTAYITKINNGYDLAVPAKSGTLATKEEVDLAANSGDQLTEKGVWYAKMYSVTVAPSAEDGTNYADFSQTDSQGNPIIVIYKRQNGAWVQDQTITPPAEYNGYVPVTSKIWDIVEQAGQQGGKVLWAHSQKTFTPSPLIISLEDAALTGVPTAPLPTDASPNNQIATKEYVDSHSSTGGYHPDLFDWKWADSLRNDVQWLRADTFSWQSGDVYQAAYKELYDDVYVSTYWRYNGTNVSTAKAVPDVGDAVYSDPDLTTQVGTVEAYDSANNTITYNGNTYSYYSAYFGTTTAETVAGITINVYSTHSGRKIVNYTEESNVSAIYAATGVAWYYIISAYNKRFKLPRSKHNKYATTLGVAGNGMVLGLTNGTNTYGTAQGYHGNDAMFGGNSDVTVQSPVSATSVGGSHYNLGGQIGVATDPANSGIIAQQEQDTDQYKYLYFYVGEFTQTALENTAGITAETLNDKVDKGHQVVAFQAPNAGNNYTWYRKYADGWIEQGGHDTTTRTASSAAAAVAAITFPAAFADTNYTFIATVTGDYNGIQEYNNPARTATGLTVCIMACYPNNTYTSKGFSWRAEGMSAS